MKFKSIPRRVRFFKKFQVECKPSGILDLSGINAYISKLLDRIVRLEDELSALRALHAPPMVTFADEDQEFCLNLFD